MPTPLLLTHRPARNLPPLLACVRVTFGWVAGWCLGLSAHRAEAAAFTVLEAREFGVTNQITLQFSEAVPNTPTALNIANYTLTPATTAKVTSAVRHPYHPEMLLIQHTGSPVEIGVSTLKNGAGVVIAAGNRTPIDHTPARPRDAGTTVSGFQDDFGGPTLNGAWQRFPATDVFGATAFAGFELSNGVLQSGGGGFSRASWLGLTGLNYDTSNQEVLLRLRCLRPANAGTATVGGPVVGFTFTEAPAASLLGGQQWLLGPEGIAPSARLRMPPGITVPAPTVLTGTSVTNWFWLRLRHLPNSLPGAVDTEAKIWVADGATPEPLAGIQWNYWDSALHLTNAPAAGLAGIAGPERFDGGYPTEFDYFLLKSPGLPEIVVTPDGQRPPRVSPLRDLIGYAGQTLRLSGSTSGDGPFTYQWRRAGIPLNPPAGSQPELILPKADASLSGLYDLVVLNAFGASTSAPALVRIIGESLYVSDFSHAGVGPEWSFTADGASLKLARPADERPALILCDLILSGAWSGLTRTDGRGPDVFEVGAPGGSNWLRTTFSSQHSPDSSRPPQSFDVQNFPAELGGPRFPPEFGAAVPARPGTFPAQTVYRLRFLIPGGGPELAAQFRDRGLGDASDVHWTLDNVIVTRLPTNQPVVRFLQRAYRVNEGVGILTLPVERTGPYNTELQIPIQVAEGGSAQPGIHFESPTEAIHFAVGARFAEVRLSILPDPKPGPPRDLTLRLAGADIIPGDIPETIVVMDDQQSGFQVDAPVATQVSEGAGAYKIHIQSYGDTSTLRLVDFEVRPGTATADLVAWGTLHAVLPPGVTDTDLILPLLDNTHDEPDRSFQVEVTGAYGGLVPLSRTEVLLLDNDGVNRPGFGLDGPVRQIAALANGTLLVRGDFHYVNGEPRPGMARLLADGSLDTTFNPEQFPSWENAQFAVLADGSVIYPAEPPPDNLDFDHTLIRVNSNGQRVATFQPAIDDSFLKTLVQPDGRVVVFGSFYHVDDFPMTGLTRLRATGERDVSFNIGSGSDFDFPETVDLLPGGKLLVTGSFFSFNGVERNGFVRLLADGNVDPGYQLDTRFGSSPSLWLVLRDGRQLVGGAYDEGFTHVEGLFQLSAAGKIVAPIPLAIGVNGLQRAATLELANHAILLAVLPVGASEVQLIRLKADLSGVDTTFHAELPTTHAIWALAEMPNQSIVVAGEFPDDFGRPKPQLLHLTPTGAALGWNAEAPLPGFNKYPAPVTVRAGDAAGFQTEGTGEKPIQYLWFRDQNPIPGATNAAFSLPQVRPEDAGNYQVLIRTPTRELLSPPARLTVLPAPARARLSIMQTPFGLVRAHQVTIGVRYRVESTSDLVNWQAESEFVAATAEEIATGQPTEASRYWRLRALP